MLDFEVRKCDTMTGHYPNYFHEQAKNRDWLIMCFQTPFSYYKDGKMIEGRVGDCLINSPGIYIKHGPNSEMKTGFQNDWMYFAGDGIESLLTKYGLPVDEHFSIDNPNFMTQHLQTIMYEKHNCQPFYEDKISCIIHNMFLDLSRCVSSKNSPYSKLGEILEGLRNEIFNSLEKNWTLQTMANKTGYSVSRFCYLYKSRFNVSPSSDLLQMRVQKSKNLLSYSDFAIGEIAAKSGFSSVHYFSYAFKKTVGISPTEYRNKNKFFM